ncbi:MAG: radical SAM protein [Coriobacteriales bacterium]
MHYSDGACWRPLFEQAGAMLQVTRGCSHNQCKFCTMFKGIMFSLSPEDEVRADVAELAVLPRGGFDRAFLTGDNAFCPPMRRLRETIEDIRATMPGVCTIGCFARIEDVARKSDDELRELSRFGASDDISIGAESGIDEALSFMRKGHTAADIVEQCERLDKADITYDLFYLAGIVGAGRYEENVQATVRVFGKTNPERIMIHMLTLFPGAPLQEDVESGAFVPSSETDVLRELRLLVELPRNETYLLGAHIGNAAPFNAFIPQQRKRVLEYLDAKIADADEAQLVYFRSHQRFM